MSSSLAAMARWSLTCVLALVFVIALLLSLLLTPLANAAASTAEWATTEIKRLWAL